MSGDFIENHTTSRESMEYAAENDLDVVLPKTNELQLDIDSDEDYRVYVKHFDFIESRVLQVKDTPSRNKPQGRHITLTLACSLAPIERIAWQAILGSDRRREGHSIVRLVNGDANPTLFFEKRETACSKTDTTSEKPTTQS